MQTGSPGTIIVDPLTTLDTTNLYVGNLEDGTLDIRNGTVTSVITVLGRNNGANGDVTVDGLFASFSADILLVGENADSTLDILDGATVTTIAAGVGTTTPGVDTTVTIDDATWNSTNLNIGNTGGGNPLVNVNNFGVLAVSDTLRVTGGNSELNTSTGGRVISDELIIEEGGEVESTLGIVGTAPITTADFVAAAVSVEVDGAGSTWTITGPDPGIDGALKVGRSNGDNATLSITNGGTVFADFPIIGEASGSIGTVEVSGSGSTLDVEPGLFRVGESGTGILNVEGGGLVDHAGTTYIGQLAGSDGSVTVGDGVGNSVLNTSFILTGGGVSSNGGTGTLTVNPGGTVNASGFVRVWDSGVVSAAGGTLNTDAVDIEQGGTVTSTNNITIGTTSTTNLGINVADELTLTSLSTLTTSGVMIVGDDVDTTLDIGGQAAPTVSAIGLFIADDAGVNAIVNINPDGAPLSGTTTVDLSSSLIVGDNGEGTLNILNRGVVNSGNTSIAAQTGSTGTINVSNLSTLNANALYVGGRVGFNGGTGLLAVTNGGTAQVTNAITA